MDLPLAWWALGQAWLHLCVTIHSLFTRVEEVAEEDEDLVYHTFNETLYHGPHYAENAVHITASIVGMM
jgi:hypothetical protein